MEKIQRIARELKQWFGKSSIGYWIEVVVKQEKLSEVEAGYLVALTD